MRLAITLKNPPLALLEKNPSNAHACENAHGNILSAEIPECGRPTTYKLSQNFSQIFKNTHKRRNKIFAAKPLLKTATFSQFPNLSTALSYIFTCS